MESPRALEPMGPNISAENMQSSPISMKRKADIGDDACIRYLPDGKENEVGVEKKIRLETPSPTSLVELKGRKLLFRQTPYTPNFPKKAIRQFQVYLSDFEDDGTKVTEIPEAHWGLLVMAGVEQQSGNETLLAKHIIQALHQAEIFKDADLIQPDAVKPLISKLLHQQNYGFQPTDFASTSTNTVKVPVALQIRAWEPIESTRWLSAEQTELLAQRKAERIQAREEVIKLLEGMDDVEKMELLDKEKKEKTVKEAEPVRGRTADPSPQVEVTRRSREGTAATADSRRSASPVKKSKMTPEEEEAFRLRKEERESKRLAREEKKAAKEREFMKKEADVAKQKQTMSMFFIAKPVASSPISRETTAGPSVVTPTKVEKDEISDYQRVFKPFVKRANVFVAPINSWSANSGSVSTSEWVKESATEESSGCSSKDMLCQRLKRHQRQRPRQPRIGQGFKSGPIKATVQEIWDAHQNAEDPRRVLNKLKNKDRFPWKTLAFDQQARPPYCGTFSKRSVVVGPRTPFAQDPLLDYSYDSGDDWEDEEGGDDVDGAEAAENQPEEEDEEEEDSEGEFDDWLDDSEDAGYDPANAMEVDEDGSADRALEQGRLAMKVTAKKQKEAPPKKVVKLVPSWKGPEWEPQFGSGTEGMEQYRLQLLNDTPIRVDPFKYTSVDPIQHFKAIFTTTAIGIHLSVRTLLSAEVDTSSLSTAVDSDPVGSAPTSTIGLASNNSTLSSTTRPRAPPKIAFPQAHLRELLHKVDGNSKILSDMISELKAHFDQVATKAAIKAVINDVAVREGKSKDSKWRVKPEAWASVGGQVNGEMMPPLAISMEVTIDA